jgi:hypothetical protein
MSRTVAFACTLAVGDLIALQPPANAAVAPHVGNLAAAVISAAITVTLLAVLFFVFSEPARLSGLVGLKTAVRDRRRRRSRGGGGVAGGGAAAGGCACRCSSPVSW